MTRRAGGRGARLPWELLALAAVVGGLIGQAGADGPLRWDGRLVGLWVVMISIIAFVTFVLDKQTAKYGGRRVSEHTLLLFAALGGTIGAGLAMLLVRHKTAKSAFLRPFWLVVGLQAAGWILGLVVSR